MRKVRDLARVMGVESLLLGESGAGSLAMAKDKSGNFYLIIDSTLKELTEQFEKDVVDPLMKLNGWPEELKPTLKVEKIQHKDVTELTQALADMAQAGAVLAPDDPAINAIRDLLGLPILTEEMMQDLATDSSLDDEGDNPDGPPVPPGQEEKEVPPQEEEGDADEVDEEETPEGPAADGDEDDDKKKKKEKVK